MEKTLAIIKPDAVRAGAIGNILARIEKEGFRIAAMKMIYMTKAQAKGFYYVHKGKDFFEDLTDFMSSGPCITLILEADNAIDRWREVMGKTDPAIAAEGTLRKLYGANIQNNATHGSDATDTAAFETAYFFNALEGV